MKKYFLTSLMLGLSLLIYSGLIDCTTSKVCILHIAYTTKFLCMLLYNFIVLITNK